MKSSCISFLAVLCSDPPSSPTTTDGRRSADAPNKGHRFQRRHSADHTTRSPPSRRRLVETLQSPGPFTVFAPTNEAFAKLPAGTVDTLLKPEYKDTHEVLTYHVVAGKVPAKTSGKRSSGEWLGHL